MNEITIMVNDRIAAANGTVYVCGNSDYTARFVFSPQWEDLPIRTARFVKVTREGTESHVDVLFQGDSCPVPNFLDAAWIYVGVFAGDRRTTTPARIRARRSILDQGGPPEEPRPDVYARILEEMNRLETALEAAVGPLTEPREGDLPTVWFGAPLAQTKEETVMSFRYVSKTRDIAGYCKTKAQGNHSLQYPKKNQTVKLYADPDCTEPLKVDFRGWGEQSKFCFKANWVDLTHARNIVSARLWGDVVEARTDYDSLPEGLRTSPNRGAVDGFPVKVFAGGVYQGRYTVNIPKDPWMANMDEDLDTHCILCGENYVSGCFRAEAVMDGTDWTDEVHDTVPDAIRTRWNEVISFVMTSTDEAFRQGLGGYFDVQSLLDYYLFGVAACGLDNFGKNQLYMTWDGQTWFASMYDLDATWGNWYNGQAFVSAEYSRNEYQDFADGEGNLLYIRLAALFPEELQARWAELRQGPLSADHILRRFEDFTSLCPPWLTEEDYAAATGDGTFTAIPGQGTNNIQQIRAYVLARLAYADGFVNREPSIYTIIPGNTVCQNSTGKFYYVGPNTPDSPAAPARATINPVAVPLRSVPAAITLSVPSGFLVGRMPLCVVDPSVSFTVDPNGANYQNFASYSAETLRDDGWQTPVNGVNTFEITEPTANMFLCTFKKTDGTVMTDDDIAALNAGFRFELSYGSP